MRSIGRWVLVCAAVGLSATGGVRTARAQENAAPPTTRQVVSANPFGLLLEFFNAEYERTVSQSSTGGFGGSFFSSGDDDYFNADAFWRFYPSGVPLDGWAFGVKAGVTNVGDGTFFGAGFDVNRSWLLGVNDNFYVGIGFGLKRLVGAGDADLGLEVIPTLRIVNVGIAF
jgi:hypothetical protein